MALKVLRVETDAAALRREVGVIQALQFRHVIQAYGAVTTEPRRMCIVLELASRGSLQQLLGDASRPLPPALRARYAQQIASGLAFIHSRGVCHRDLKSPNVLISNDGTCKLSDFGLARVIELTLAAQRQHSSSGARVGTPAWMAPELHDDDKSTADFLYDRIDSYAFGMVLYELLTREAPWRELSLTQLLRALDRGRRPELPLPAPAALQPVDALMRELWAQEPTERPPINGACVARLEAVAAACEAEEARAHRGPQPPPASPPVPQEAPPPPYASREQRVGGAAQSEAALAEGARSLEALAAALGLPTHELLAQQRLEPRLHELQLDLAVALQGLGLLLARSSTLKVLNLGANNIGDGATMAGTPDKHVDLERTLRNLRSACEAVVASGTEHCPLCAWKTVYRMERITLEAYTAGITAAVRKSDPMIAAFYDKCEAEGVGVDSAAQQRCCVCGQRGDAKIEILSCSQCKTTKYCSRECQKDECLVVCCALTAAPCLTAAGSRITKFHACDHARDSLPTPFCWTHVWSQRIGRRTRRNASRSRRRLRPLPRRTRHSKSCRATSRSCRTHAQQRAVMCSTACTSHSIYLRTHVRG